MAQSFKVRPEDLTRRCSDDPFQFKTTAELEPLDSIIGQKRAVEAIHFGLKMEGPGYHMFISGAEGTGKTTIARELLTAHAAQRETPGDICLVNDFDDPYRPRPLEMTTGSASFFSRRMEQFLESVKIKLPKAFENKSFQERQAELKKSFAQAQQALFSPVETKARDLGIGIVQTEQGYQPVPVKDGRPVTQEEFSAFTPEQKAAVQKGLDQIAREISGVAKQVRVQALEMQKEVEKAAMATAAAVFTEEMDISFSDFKNLSQVRQFLEELKEDMVEHSLQFMMAAHPDGKNVSGGQGGTELLKNRYRVNVLVDRRGEKGAPVVFEPSPSYQNLFGKVGQVMFPGGPASDITSVRAGAVMRANKGYLVLEVESLLRNPLVWETLKNTLQNRTLVIQDAPEQFGVPVAAMKTRPIPVDVKVVLIGGYDIFRALQGADPKFNKLFKVRADFDHEVVMDRDNLVSYARFIARVCRSEKLLPFTACGTTAVVEYGNRIAEDKRKLSLRFGQVLGLLKEADFWARQDSADAVADSHVRRALNQYRFRHNLYEEKVQERYDDHSILMDVSGDVVGQVNALAVYQIGEIAFGRPSRITAESYMGKPGIVNIEHEAQLSGQTHDKGVMIISGYLGRMFAQTYPLSVTISVTFEQSYGGIDGDSASSTELYAVLSSLSGHPIDQGVAVTGSVNQKGQIQSIGGVNEKIEGFYDVCVRKGLTGSQGVMIPASNVNNLMLRKDVVEAVENGRFHIYQVRTVEEGIEILTGVPAGVPGKDGRFPSDTLFGAVQAKLKSFHERSVKYSR